MFYIYIVCILHIYCSYMIYVFHICTIVYMYCIYIELLYLVYHGPWILPGLKSGNLKTLIGLKGHTQLFLIAKMIR